MRIIMLLLVCLTFASCFEPVPKEDPKPDPKVENPDTTPEEVKIVGEWKHSAEENTETEKIYRVASYKFPPARAREGFVFKEDGTVVMKTIAPNDTFNETNGTWEQKEISVEIALEDEEKTKISLLTSKLEEGILIQSIAKR